MQAIVTKKRTKSIILAALLTLTTSRYSAAVPSLKQATPPLIFYLTHNKYALAFCASWYANQLAHKLVGAEVKIDYKTFAGMLGVAMGTELLVDYAISKLSSSTQDSNKQELLKDLLPNLGLGSKNQDAYTDIENVDVSAVSTITIPQELQRVLNIINPEESFKPNYKLALPTGVLLYGPSGSGKTTIIKAVAAKTNTAFVAASASDLISRWAGGTSNAVKDLFDRARTKLKTHNKVLVFIDEIDALAQERTYDASASSRNANGIVDTLLAEMRGLKSSQNIIVFAATNHPDQLDNAIKTRFSHHIEIPLPDNKARADILEKTWNSLHPKQETTETQEASISEIYKPDFKELALKTHGANCADLSDLIKNAVTLAYDDKSETIKATHIEQALEQFITKKSKANHTDHFENSMYL